MTVWEVEKEKCLGCGMCVSLCPFDSIRITGLYPEVAYTDSCVFCNEECTAECDLITVTHKVVDKQPGGNEDASS